MNEKASKSKGSPLVFKPEQQFLQFLEDHLLLISIAVVTVFALLLRYAVRDYVSGDAYYYLLPWYEQMKGAGFGSLAKPVGNYNMLYQFFIALFTYLPMEALHAYKLFSVIFDLLLAFLAMRIVLNNTVSHSKVKAVAAYAAVLISPIIFLNSACWGQCDVIYTYFCVYSIYEMYKDKYLASIILFGVAVTFKLQAVFILPFLLLCYFCKKRFSFLYFLTIPVVMVVLSLPGIVMGRGIAEIFTVYFDQTSTYNKISMNYPSFWTLFQSGKMNDFYASFKSMAVFLTVCVLLAFIFVWIKKKVKFSWINMLSMAFLLSYTCVMFLPAMHERYGFVYEVLGLLIAFWYYKTIPMLFFMYITSLQTYGSFLFGFGMNLTELSFVNLAVYVAYAFYLNRKLLKDCGGEDDEKIGKLLLPAKS